MSFIFENIPVSFHLYADDTQLYISFSSSDSAYSLTLLSSTLDKVYLWLTSNRLSVNPQKTEYLLIGTPHQREKVSSSSVFFYGQQLTPSSQVRNLGVLLDPELSYQHHISKICSNSVYHMRQIRQIRS